jgi:hypothetical protein
MYYEIINMKELNYKQKTWLENWRKENSFSGPKEPEWTPATVIHSCDIEYIYQELKKLEQ